MKLTYTDLFNSFLDNTGNTGSSATNLTNFFKRNLSARYQQTLSVFDTFQTEQTLTATTVAAQQYYHKPPSIMSIEAATVTVGNIAYPLNVIDSLRNWQKINETLISTTAIPQFLFPRKDDFGIWPIPQGEYTITFTAHARDRSLTVADYTTGTVAVSNNSTTVTGSGTSWTEAMIGRWFNLNDATAQDQGEWYRISAVGSTTSLTIETAYAGVTVSGKSYRIGEVPEIPDEGHILLAQGVTSDYFAYRGDIAKATWWNNVFYTGDGQNSSRDGVNITGGLIGMRERYSTRSDSAIIRHTKIRSAGNDKNWATTISSS